MVNPSPDVDVRGFLLPTVFGRLPPEVLDELLSFAQVERFAVPTLLNRAGQPLKWLRLVVDGRIEIVARKSSGKEVAITDVGPGAWATWLPCFIPAPPEHDFYASAASFFIALPVAQVKAFCDDYPLLYPLIMEEVGKRLRLLMEWTGQSVLMGPEQRMAKLIHILARDQQIKANSGTLVAHQTRLASLARCSRQTANGLLIQLEKRQLIRLSYGKVDIVDMRYLAEFADREGPGT